MCDFKEIFRDVSFHKLIVLYLRTIRIVFVKLHKYARIVSELFLLS